MKNNMPKLRFREFTDEWQEKKLGDIADVKGGKRIPKGYSLLVEDNGLPYLTVSGMKKNSFDFSEVRFVPEAIADQIKNYKITVDDIYVSVAGTLGLVGTIPKELDGANLTENANKLTNIKANRNFILQYLRSDRFSKLVNNVKTDNAQPKLAIYALQGFKMTVPEVPEQKKIAGFLTVVDEKIGKLEEKKKGFEKYKKGVMQAIFSQKIRFKKPDGSNYPDWEERKLGEVFTQTKGAGLSWEQVDENGNNKCILYGELYTTYNEIILEVKSRTNLTNGVKSQKGDLLIPCSTTTSGIDLANVTELVEDNVLLGGDITILRAKEPVVSTFYAYYLTYFKKHQIAIYAQGSTIVHLYFSHFEKMIIDIPPIEEQEKIAGFLTALDDKINLINNQLEQAKLFKRSLLQRMFV